MTMLLLMNLDEPYRPSSIVSRSLELFYNELERLQNELICQPVLIGPPEWPHHSCQILSLCAYFNKLLLSLGRSPRRGGSSLGIDREERLSPASCPW